MAAETRRDVFQAIADPTRRQIIQLVAGGGLNLNAIAENFSMSRPAVSQHVKILTECGLLLVRREGRERICEAKLDALAEVAAWVGQYREFWTAQLDALEAFLQKTEKTHSPKNK
jgi:DNA-binding transcriptional ArsR family regulator